MPFIARDQHHKQGITGNLILFSMITVKISYKTVYSEQTNLGNPLLSTVNHWSQGYKNALRECHRNTVKMSPEHCG